MTKLQYLINKKTAINLNKTAIKVYKTAIYGHFWGNWALKWTHKKIFV
jgi:hypothetical protein